MKAALRNHERIGGRAGWITALCLVILATLPLPAAAVLLDIASGIPAAVGDTLDVAIVTESLTGLGVYSYECEITFNASYLRLIDVVETGSLSAGWGPPLFSPQAGSVQVAAAGGTPLSGAGDLVYLRFVAGPSWGTIAVSFGSFLFNEGLPVATTSNGSVSIATPASVSVSPNSGEIVVGDALAFSAFGTGTPPYTWNVTNPSVASIDASGLLTGIGPGATRVYADDANAVRDSTSGDILVRAMALSAPASIGAAPGDPFVIPISVTDLTGLDVRAFEFDLTFTAARFDVVAATFTSTIASAWGAPSMLTEPGRVRIAAANATALSGSGVLVQLICTVPADGTSSTALTLTNGLFDERYVPLHVNGFFSTLVPPTISIFPNTATLATGETLGFGVSGATAPPWAWGTTDPAVGTIDAAGLFTAVGGGECFVYVEDMAGAKDTTAAISVCDVRVSIPNTVVQTAIPATAVPVLVDRDVSPLEIYGYEFTVSFNTTRVNVMAATDSGSISSGWGAPVVHVYDDSVRVVHAGSTPLTGSGTLVHLYFEPDPAASTGQTTAASFDNFVFNEGTPIPCTANGVLTVDDTITGVEGPWQTSGLALAQNRPNPFVHDTTIQLTVFRESAGDLALTILDAGGRQIRRYDLAGATPGPHSVRWDGRDGAGRQVSSGVYFYRLSGVGEDQVRKMVLIR